MLNSQRIKLRNLPELLNLLQEPNYKRKQQNMGALKVQTAMAKNPNMTAKQIQEVSAQAEQEFQAQSVKQILKQVKKNRD